VSSRIAKAELLEDRGNAVVSDDCFRSRPFLEAEGVTHTLRIQRDAGELLAPLIVREIPGSNARDAISPYGYPGLVGGRGHAPRSLPAVAPPGMPSTPPALDPRQVDFSATGLVSIFLRHTLDQPPLAAATERNVVQIADPALPPKSRPSDRRQVRRNLEAGYALALVPGPETATLQRAGFLDVYEQTMRRTAAADHYFFGQDYFDRILQADGTWLALLTAPTGETAAASIAAVSDGFLHYYLSGSADAHLRDSPMKNVVSRLVELANELELPLNLGGGLIPGDALEEFKRGFANRRQTWHTSEIVCDEEKYNQLSGNHVHGAFFPTYRAP
jgi:GNAT acetyltransferase-like protein